MQLDVIVPTYNRQELLRRTIDSLFAAEVPAGLEVRVTVVDNNSKDGTRQLVAEQMDKYEGRLNYIFEGQPGKSFALNTAIAATKGDLVGIIDDDEEVDQGWYKRVHAAFSVGNIDFIGGPYVPRWGAEQPAWLPMGYRGVIGWVDSGNEILPYGENFPGILMGGNAVLTRTILEKVGPYTTAVGPNDKLLLRGEDDDMYYRLLDAGARGLYLPDLIIYHYVPPERLTKKYFRRWCFWRGVGMAVLDRERPTPVAYLCGVPRWLYGQAARGAARKVKGLFSRDPDPARSFTDELAAWDLAGFFYGKHFYRSS